MAYVEEARVLGHTMVVIVMVVIGTDTMVATCTIYTSTTVARTGGTFVDVGLAPQSCETVLTVASEIQRLKII